MRSVLVTTSYPSRPEDAAGHFVRTEAMGLASGGDDVHVVAPAGAQGLLVRDEGVTTWPIAHGGAFGWPGAASRLRARPWRLAGAATFAALASSRLERLQPDRVIAHWLVPCAFPVVATCRLDADVAAVAHGADVRMLLALPAPVRAEVVSRVLEAVGTIRFAARASHDALAAALPKPMRASLAEKACVRPADLWVPDVSASASQLRAGFGSRPFAVTVSRLVRSKRVDLAIEAAHLLYPELALGVVGDGPDRERLVRLPGARDARFSGNLPREQALAWIAAADVLVHPSVAEAAPTVIREARLLGTPVVACDAGDVGRWAKDDPGIVLAEPEPGCLATAIASAVVG